LVPLGGERVSHMEVRPLQDRVLPEGGCSPAGLEAALRTVDALVPAATELRGEGADLRGPRQDLECSRSGMVDAREHSTRFHGDLGFTRLHKGMPQLELFASVPLDACAMGRQVPAAVDVLEPRLWPGPVMAK